MENRQYFPLNGVRICINEKKPAILGQAFSPLSETAIDFSDIGQLMISLDALFDKAGYPQSFQDKRSFGESEGGNRYKGRPAPKTSGDVILSKSGLVATFDLIIDSRRDSSWQGTVYQSDGTPLGSFVGDMDLLKLIFANM